MVLLGGGDECLHELAGDALLAVAGGGGDKVEFYFVWDVLPCDVADDVLVLFGDEQGVDGGAVGSLKLVGCPRMGVGLGI